MSQENASTDQWLEKYRSYLRAITSASMRRHDQRRFDASDIVQAAMLKAVQKQSELQSTEPTAVSAWLRAILVNVLVDEVRRHNAGKRDLRREQSLENDLNNSAAGLDRFAASQSTPSVAAQKDERRLELANALLQLPDDQQEVVVLKHLQNLTLQQIADGTGRTVPAIAGLLRRGLARLRELMPPD